MMLLACVFIIFIAKRSFFRAEPKHKWNEKWAWFALLFLRMSKSNSEIGKKENYMRKMKMKNKNKESMCVCMRDVHWIQCWSELRRKTSTMKNEERKIARTAQQKSKKQKLCFETTRRKETKRTNKKKHGKSVLNNKKVVSVCCVPVLYFLFSHSAS